MWEFDAWTTGRSAWCASSQGAESAFSLGKQVLQWCTWGLAGLASRPVHLSHPLNPEPHTPHCTPHPGRAAACMASGQSL